MECLKLINVGKGGSCIRDGGDRVYALGGGGELHLSASNVQTNVSNVSACSSPATAWFCLSLHLNVNFMVLETMRTIKN